MEKNAQSTGGFWMLVEEISTEPANENRIAAEDNNGILDDEFFPDTSF